MLFNNKREGDENMSQMEYVLFLIGLGIILTANIILAVIMCYGIYIGAL